LTASASPRSVAANVFADGDRIGNYRIESRLGPGGMGVVYLARREGVQGFSRAVALKVVHTHLAEDAGFIRMFVQEALLASRIHHPNVVHVEEFGQDKDTYFLAMEYVRGASLSSLISALEGLGRQLSPAVSTAIAAQVADGLHAAHETPGDDGAPLGVVHRDVSPQNILLSVTGHVKLIDFGVAKARGLSQASTGGLKGKLRYMAPEQARAHEVDRRADVYSLAVVLWELLMGRALFEADSELELLDRVRFPSVPSAASLGLEIPSALERVLLRALSVEPDARPATAHAFRDELLDAFPDAARVGPRGLAELMDASSVSIPAPPPSDELSTAATARERPEAPPSRAETLASLTLSRRLASPPQPIALPVATPRRARWGTVVALSSAAAVLATVAIATRLHTAPPSPAPAIARATATPAPLPAPPAVAAAAPANVIDHGVESDAGVHAELVPVPPVQARDLPRAHGNHRNSAGLLPRVPLASDPGR
jgi:serine/threonine-protein kinase